MPEELPSLPSYSHGVPVIERSQQKPLIRVMNKMLTKRLKLPHGKVQSQTVKIKEKKVKYW